jgi:hypothetical protein
MTARMSAAATLTWLLLALGGAVHANEVVSVGRIDMQLPGEGWQSFAVPDQGNAMSGAGETYRQQTETRVVWRRDANQTIDAVFVVRANLSGKGRFSGIAYSDARCEGPAGTFTEGDAPGVAAKSFRCLFVSQPGAVRLPDGLLQQLQGALGQQGWKQAPSMHLIVAKQYANTGAFADVTALLVPDVLPEFAEASAQTADPLPAGVSMASVHWGRMLQKAVTDSVYSVWGKLPVPDFLPSGAPSRSN